MFSDISGLGGTHVQQSFRSRRNICAAVFCMPFPQIFMSRIFLYIQKQFNLSLLSYMSYQNHVGLQPANLVTAPTVSCSRSELFVLYRYSLQQPVLHLLFLDCLFVSSRISSFFDRLRPNYSTDFRRQLRTVRDISELYI